MLLFILFLIIQSLCIYFAGHCLSLIDKKDMNYLSKFLKKFMKIMIGVIVISFIISLIASIIEYIETPLIFVVAVEKIISLYFILVISNYSIKFVNNLIEDKIFVKDNHEYLLEVSKTFIYYSLISAIGGIIMSIVHGVIINVTETFVNTSYTITISSSFFMNLLFGVIFYVLSLIFERSVELYEENKLTI